MSAHDRLDALRLRLSEPLPGDVAKQAMLPRMRRLQPRGEEGAGLREAAVLVLLFPEGHDLVLPLMRRRTFDGDVHSGQISLPGGGREAGEDLSRTALREAEEELGLDPREIEILGELSPQWIPVSRYRVHPFVATMSARPTYVPDPVEVDRVVETSIDALHDDRTRVVRELDLRGSTMPVPGWDLPEGFLWGATAMILAELLAITPGRDPRTRRS